ERGSRIRGLVGGGQRHEEVDAERPGRRGAHGARGLADLGGGEIGRPDEAERPRLADGGHQRRGVPAAGQRGLDDRVAQSEPLGEAGGGRHASPRGDAPRAGAGLYPRPSHRDPVVASSNAVSSSPAPAGGRPTTSSTGRGPMASSAVPGAMPFTPTKAWDSRK